MDPRSGEMVVTNLRLPGQYDERLFATNGISGLQGPYYNWNRWNVPRVGRYLELDPLALSGESNTEFGVDWYEYAEQNPARWTDADGLAAQLCRRYFWPFPIPGPLHCYVQFNGNNDDTLSFDPDGVHKDPAKPWYPRLCFDSKGPDNDDCVRREMKKCMAKDYNLIHCNCCDCAQRALEACGLRVPWYAWPNWPVNPHGPNWTPPKGR